MIICTVGDSLTAATGGPAGLGWPGFIAARLAEEFEGLTVYNLGVRGDASTKVAKRWKEEVAYRSIEGTPMALIFSLGTADCVQQIPQEETMEAVRSILTGAKEFGKPALIGPSPVADETTSTTAKELSDAFKELCEELEVPYLPIYEYVVESPIYKADLEQGDGVHPKTPGYSQIAQAVLEWEGLNTILNK